MRNIVLVLAAVAILLGIEVHTASIRNEQPRCDVFQDVNKAWFGCHNITLTELSADPVGYAESQCRQKETDLACIREIFASCDNIDVIMQAIGATFPYCNGNTLDIVFSDYLQNQFTSIDEECEEAITIPYKQCLQQAFKPFLTGTLNLSNGLQSVFRATTDMVNCFAPLMEIPTVPACGGESGLKLVTDFLAGMTLINIVGSVTYDGFMAMLLLQQTIAG